MEKVAEYGTGDVVPSGIQMVPSVTHLAEAARDRTVFFSWSVFMCM